MVDTIHPPEDKNYADHPANYKALLPSGIATDVPLITRALSSYPVIDWYNYDSALFCFCLLQLFSDPSLQLLLVFSSSSSASPSVSSFLSRHLVIDGSDFAVIVTRIISSFKH